MVAEHWGRVCPDYQVSISPGLLLCQKRKPVSVRNYLEIKLVQKMGSRRNSSLIQSLFGIFNPVVCGRWDVRPWVGASRGMLCHSILLFNAAVNEFLLLTPYEEGQVVSWQWECWILQTKMRLLNQLCCYKGKKKSLETGRKGDCKEESLQTPMPVSGAGCSGEEKFRAGAILNYYLMESLHFLRGGWGSCFLLATERLCASHSLK